MRFFRLLHRRTKSEGDVSDLLFQSSLAGITAPVFVPLPVSLPSFDPTSELYASPTHSIQSPMDSKHTDKLNARIIELEAQLSRLRGERSTLEKDLDDYRTDLFATRTELYSEMLRGARHQQQAMNDFRTIQELEARHQRFCTLLVDIGISRSTVDMLCQVIRSGKGSPDDIIVDAIKDASNDDTTLLAKLKPIVTNERTPEHYQSALNLTLSIRKELKSQKKRSKFWKKLAQEGDRHASAITPSPSDISSIRQDLSPERQGALDALISRRRAARYPENAEGDVFGGQRRESALDTLASSLASRPRHSIQDDLRLSSSFSSSSTSSASTTYLSYLSGLSGIPRNFTNETPTIQSRPPSTLSTSLRRFSRSSSQSIVLGSRNLNVSRSSSIDPTLEEETEQQTDLETGPASMVTFSQDLPQNVRRASQEHGLRRVPSTASRRSGPTHSTRSSFSSFRLSAFSTVLACRTNGPSAAPDPDMSANKNVDPQSFHTPDVMMRLSDLTTNTDMNTPASSEATRNEDTPFNDARTLPKYGVDTPFSPMDLEVRVASTPPNGFVACKPLCGNTPSHNTRFLEHVDSTMSVSTSASASEASAVARDGHEHERGREDDRACTDMNTATIANGESNDSLFTTSASASASSLTANDTSAPTTPPTPSPSLGTTPLTDSSAGTPSVRRSMLPVLAKHFRRLSLSGTSPERERLMSKLRVLRSLPRSRSGSGGSMPGLGWRGSHARSESNRSENLAASPSPVKGSGIPVLQRRLTIRARRTSVRKA